MTLTFCSTSTTMNRLLKLFAALVMTLACGAVWAAASDIGALVIHGKWGSPARNVDGLVRALESEGIIVRAPEMPWSRQRLYDKGVEGADAEMDAEIAKLRDGGAKQIFLIGHSLGAAYALHLASRILVTGVIAIAPGHRPEGIVYGAAFADDVQKARTLVANGKGDEPLSFLDLNTGNRREQVRASAASFLSYFDPAGAMNMADNMKRMKPEIPVLWIVPTREDPRSRPGYVNLYKNLPANSGTRMAEPDSDHLDAPDASTRLVIDWIREITAKK